MRNYGDYNGNSGITGYDFDELNDAFIDIEYSNGNVHRYFKSRVGEINYLNMKVAALQGRGLNGYINKHVRGKGVKLYPTAEPTAEELTMVTFRATDAKAVALLTELLTKSGVKFTIS